MGITFPEIYDMQVRAIFEAITELIAEKKVSEDEIMLEIMIPLVSHVRELEFIEKNIQNVTQEVLDRKGINLKFSIGTMIELPRAALTAEKIAEKVNFFSFGTNDLTQSTFGFSRDDAEGKFLSHYMNEKKILDENPFEILDQEGVGRLIKMAIEEGRKANPNLKVGICGEHGGEPKSIAFCHRNDLDYVSCSPFRIMIARVAAAQAQIEFPR
jgi:pyruvate,orthophosphate dikinase